MRAQFALIEALVSFTFVAAAVVSVQKGISIGNLNFEAAKAKLQQAVAIYDIFNEISRNASANNCVNTLYTGEDQTCVQSLGGEYSKIYGLRNISIGANVSQRSSFTKCLPVRLQEINQTRQVCVSMSD